MRKVVLAMMTTLNGRLDDPGAWMTGVSEDQYQEIDRGYATFDTILVGRTTAEEMAAYWPTAGEEEGASEPQKSMAEKMHSYHKYVFTSDPGWTLEWHNTESVVVTTDAGIRSFVEDLKASPGQDIHLSGGARLAQTMVRLGLVDEYRLFVYPVYSPGQTWYGALTQQTSWELISSTSFVDGVVALYCKQAA